jgi:hypothetical protein
MWGAQSKGPCQPSVPNCRARQGAARLGFVYVLALWIGVMQERVTDAAREPVQQEQGSKGLSEGSFDEVEHRAPDCFPFAALLNEDPQIPACCAAPLPGSFVDHH